MVDGEFENDQWDKWLNSAINAMSNAIESGFRRMARLTVANSEVKLPAYMSSVKEVYLQNSSGGWDAVLYYPNADIRSEADKYYYLEDNKLKTSWTANGVVLEVHAECSATPLTNDMASPDFIIPEFQDIISIYAAMLCQIYDGELETSKALQGLYTPRMSMFINKIKKTQRGGKRSFGFINGVI